MVSLNFKQKERRSFLRKVKTNEMYEYIFFRLEGLGKLNN